MLGSLSVFWFWKRIKILNRKLLPKKRRKTGNGYINQQSYFNRNLRPSFIAEEESSQELKDMVTKLNEIGLKESNLKKNV